MCQSLISYTHLKLIKKEWCGKIFISHLDDDHGKLFTINKLNCFTKFVFKLFQVMKKIKLMKTLGLKQRQFISNGEARGGPPTLTKIVRLHSLNAHPNFPA